MEDDEDNHKRVKFVNNTQQDNNLDELKSNSKIIHLKEQYIKDPFTKGLVRMVFYASSSSFFLFSRSHTFMC